MEWIDFEEQYGTESINYPRDEKVAPRVSIFNRTVGQKALQTFHRRNTDKLVINCSVPVPGWFHTTVTQSIECVELCKNYPRTEIVKIANSFFTKKICKRFVIMLDKNENLTLNFNNSYSPYHVVLDCKEGRSKVLLMNAPCITTLYVEGRVDVEIRNCIMLDSIVGKNARSLKMQGDTCRALNSDSIVGHFEKILVDKKMDYGRLQTIPKNKLDCNVAYIWSNLTHLEKNPKYKSLLGYKIIVISCGKQAIDLSKFEIPEVDKLIILGDLGCNKLVLPKIGRVKKLKIACPRIKNTYFGHITKIDEIKVFEPYTRSWCEFGEYYLYRYTKSYYEMIKNIAMIFDNLVLFNDIILTDFHVLHEPESNPFYPGNGILTQDKYIELTGKYRDVKSASNV